MSVAKIWAVICASVACATAYNSTLHPPKALFRPEPGKSISYPRIVELPDGTILTTASYSSRLDRMNYFPVFSSSDGGSTWTWLSNLTDQANGQGLSAQPALAVLPEDMGDFPQGTVLASGLSTSNFSSVIDLYASLDQGVTWQFVSNVARGSGPGIQNGNPCIWEPFILYFNDTLGVFYSDQRDPLHGQKLAHQESTDMVNWGPVVDDVAYPRYTDRPGMTDITYIPPINKWLFVHEFPGGDSSFWGKQPNPVYYRFADSPFQFRYTYSYPITVNGVQSNASPQVVWTSAGGHNGTIIVSDNHWNSVFTNTWNGEPDKWEMHASGAPRCYSRPMLVGSDNPDHLLFVSAGSDGQGGSALTSTISSIAEILKNSPDPRDK